MPQKAIHEYQKDKPKYKNRDSFRMFRSSSQRRRRRMTRKRKMTMKTKMGRMCLTREMKSPSP